MLEDCLPEKDPDKCWFCLTKQQGCYLIAVFRLTVAIISFTLYAKEYGNGGGHHPYSYMDITNGLIFLLISEPVLLIGACKPDGRAWLKAHLAINGIHIIIAIAFGIVIMATMTTEFPMFQNDCRNIAPDLEVLRIRCGTYKVAIVGMTGGIGLGGLVIQIYLWMSVWAYHEEIERDFWTQAQRELQMQKEKQRLERMMKNHEARNKSFRERRGLNKENA